LNIQEFQEIARSRGGELLSTEYLNKEEKLKWKCSKGHIWEARGGCIKNGKSWCKICNYSEQRFKQPHKLTLKVYQDIAAKYGGKVLSSEYSSANEKLTFQCKGGHIWDAAASSVKNGNRWCPHCSKSRSETVCREILENIIGCDFPNTRPEFLQGLELDGYNKTMRLAFEYNGEQHYKYKKHFHRDPEDFNKQLERDRRKYKLCAENKVDLIIIPYTFDFNNKDELEIFIRDELEKLGH
jgi:uncharacterized protein YkuJ